MLRLRLAAVLLFLASPLFASPLTLYVLTAEPRGASPAGGQLVHLRTNGNPIFFEGFPPMSVTFGDVPGQIVQIVWWNDLVVMAPPHDAGLVTVTVSIGEQQYKTIDYFGYGVSERVLIPIAVDSLPGANGTRWTTEIWVHNDADHAVPLNPEYCSFIGRWSPCGLPVTRIAAHGTMRLTDRYGTARDPYAFVSPPWQDADSLQYSILVRELTTGQTTSIAAVRERDLHSGRRIIFPAVANDGRRRAALRLYTGEPLVTVSIADAATGKVLDVRTIRHIFPTDVTPFAYDSLSDLFATPELRGHERLDVIVDPGSYWALLTLTDNETQQVTVLTP